MTRPKRSTADDVSRAARDEAVGEYKTLIKSLVAGEDVSQQAAESILQVAGKSPEGLEKDVAAALRIQELKEILDGEAALREKLGKLDSDRMKEKDEEEKELEEVYAKHAVAYEAYLSEEAELRGQLRRCDDARRELRALTTLTEQFRTIEKGTRR